MSDARLTQMRDLIQDDPGQRGLRTDPVANLVNACPEDFAQACHSIAERDGVRLAVVTGFFIPDADPPGCETDGPPGAVFLARALVPMGIDVLLATDAVGRRALDAGLGAAGFRKQVPVVVLPSFEEAEKLSAVEYRQCFTERTGSLTHLVGLERVGPGHSLESIRQSGASDDIIERFLQRVPADEQHRCHTVRGRDVTPLTSPAHLLFESASYITIGIGDGGNEIGMGKIPWNVIDRNIPGGGRIACRVKSDHLIVCGVSNWGAYALAAGVRLLRGQHDRAVFDPEREQSILETMIQNGPLVDGLTGRQTLSVDGLPFERHAAILQRLADIVEQEC